MAAVMKDTKGKMDRDEDDDNDSSQAAVKALPLSPVKGGFFQVYKRGQGKITRLVTGIAAGAFIGLCSFWLYTTISVRLIDALVGTDRTREAATALGRNIALGSAVALFAVGAFFIWRLMNSPRGAEFLITTDAEMKKVNWASRKELAGSTRVVIIFLILVGVFLFLSDLFFGWFFHVIGVLKTGPFGS